MNLRPYQKEAVDAVFEEFKRVNSTLVVMATGLGKTPVFAKVAERFRPEGRTLVLAHRDELIQQATDKVRQWTDLTVGIEKAEQSVAGAFLPDVTVASVQTLSQQRRRDRFRSDDFGLIVTDEAHHISNTYQLTYQHFAGALKLGLTATAFRADGRALGAVYESVAYALDIRDGIEQQYLCPITQKAVYIDSLDLSKVKTTAGDLNEGELDKILREDRHLHAVAQPTAELSGNRPTLVFCTTVQHAKDIADTINIYRGVGSAMAMDGSMNQTDRRRALKDFHDGKFQYLCNCALLLEGFDEPSISCIVMARPTKSRVLYIQACGRGTRIHPGKEHCLILDFVGNAGKHSLITALDIFDGNTDEEVKKRAQKKLNEDGDITLDQALDEAANDIAAEKRRHIQVETRYRAVDIDPFAMLGVHPRAGRWGGAPITPKQQAVLEKAKIPYEGLDRGQASQIIDKLFSRREQGLCTLPQATVLLRNGFNPDVPFAVARAQLDALASFHWKLSAQKRTYIEQMAQGVTV